MAFKMPARTRERTGTTGTGDILVSGLINADNMLFSAGMNIGDTAFMCVVSGDLLNWQEFLGTYSALNTIQRTTTIANSLGTTANINLLGTSRIFVVFPSNWNLFFDQLWGSTANSFLVRGASVWNALSAASATALLSTVVGDTGSGGTKGLAPAPGVGDAAANKFLKADGTYAVPAGSGLSSALTSAHLFVGNVGNVATDVAASGDISLSNAGAFTIVANAVTNTKAAPMAGHTFKGNNTGATANPIDLTAAQLTAELNAVVGDTGAGGTKGLAPAPGAGDAAANKFLKADGTYAVPAGTGPTNISGLSDVLIASIADNDILVYINSSSKWLNKRARYIVGVSVSGVLTASQQLSYHRFTKAVTIPANFGSYLGHSSQAGGTANATASTVISVDKAPTATPNTFSNVGTITIGAGGVSPTFASSGGAAISFAQGDLIRFVGPASADATFAGFYATIVGYET